MADLADKYRMRMMKKAQYRESEEAQSEEPPSEESLEGRLRKINMKPVKQGAFAQRVGPATPTFGSKRG